MSTTVTDMVDGPNKQDQSTNPKDKNEAKTSTTAKLDKHARRLLPRLNDAKSSISVSTLAPHIPVWSVIAHRICQIIEPTTLCAIYTFALVRVIELGPFREYDNGFVGRAYGRLIAPAEESYAQIAFNNLIVVMIILAVIAAVTLIILFVLYIGFHDCLTYYFYLPSLVIMALVTPALLRQVLVVLEVGAVDMITFALCMWNFTAFGLICIFGTFQMRGPIVMQHLYLIHNSCVVAVLIILVLPSWTPWLLLSVLVVWDLFAVLAPFGPLNMILELAERSGLTDMPGLIYNAEPPEAHETDHPNQREHNNGMHHSAMQNEIDEILDHENNLRNKQAIKTIESDATDPTAATERASPLLSMPTSASKNSSTATQTGLKSIVGKTAKEELVNIEGNTNEQQRNNNPISMPDPNQQVWSVHEGRSRKSIAIEDRGVNIGLGDFIFFSLLIGLTARGRDHELGHYYSTLAAFLAILIGVILTLVALAAFRRALPALPISIALGLLITPCATHFVPRLAIRLTREQLFV